MLKEKLKNSKGITLIALIITVIVMLILVAVTVSIALNGGIFDQARTAAKDTNKASAREVLQAALVGAYDPVTGEIDASKLQTNLGDEWTIAAGENSYTCTKQNSSEDEEEATTISFEISKNGTITDGEEVVAGKVDLSGEYYAWYEGGSEPVIIIENNTFNADGSIFEMTINEENETLTIAEEVEELVNNVPTGGTVKEEYVYGYKLIEENGKIVNKIIIARDEETGEIWGFFSTAPGVATDDLS